jgi:hypothetical protein
MRRSSLLIVFAGLVFLTLVGVVGATELPTLVHLQVKDRAEQDRVGRIINLDEQTRGFDLYGWATPEELKELQRLGYDFEVVEDDRDPLALTMCSDPDGPPFEPPASWNCYPTYSQYVDLMNYYATTYPSLCRLVDIGGTQDGDHHLLALKISDNPDVEEDEPEFFYTATMHGDETTGYVLTLRLAHELLTQYSTDTEISGLVNNLVIWINPLANPDGTFAGGDGNVSGSQRSLSNGADPNRSFPDPRSGDDPGTGSWETEVQAMMDLAEAESFVMSANFHGGAEVVNYPWDVWTGGSPDNNPHPDDAWYQTVSHIYADAVHVAAPSGYMDGFDNGITNGGDWYTIDGGRQDFMNYYHGCREVTIELSDSKTLDSNQLETHWGYNRQAMLDFMKEALNGIRGLVTDSVTGDPVAATIKVVGHDDETYKTYAYSDPDFGDYHRPIEAGTWDLEFSAWGYISQTVSDITVSGPAVSVLQNVAMVRDSDSVSVSGTITDSESGLPVPGAAVRLTGSPLPAIHCDASGDYVFSSVMAGSYSLAVTAEDYHDGSSSVFSVSAGGADLDVDLALAPILHISVSGTITNAGTGEPIEGAAVVFSGPSSGLGTSNGSGVYVVADLVEGSYQVRVSASNFASIQQTVQLDQAIEQIDFQLDSTTDLLNEDFENDDGGFTASGSWQWGVDSTAGSASGTKVWGTVLGSDYADNADWTLDSPSIDLGADLDTAQLEFAHWYALESGYDGGQILVSVDGGAYQRLTPDPDYPDSTVNGLGNQPGYTGNSSGWMTARVDLTPYIGHAVVLRWRFGSDSSEQERGWYIDDVMVKTTGGTPPETPLFADGFESGDTGAWGN